MKVRVTKSVIPNLLTLANLFCGFSAIISISNNEFERGIFFIVMGAVFDLLDGLVARLIGAASELGVQLDSLSDLVSFGLAPSFLLYKVFFYQFGDIGLFISSLPAIAGATRLARFNVMLTSLEDKKYFTGMPIPGAAITLLSFVKYILLERSIGIGFSIEIEQVTTFVLVILIALGMVSRIKFFNIPKPSKNLTDNIKFGILLLLIIIAIISKGYFIFPIMISYFSICSIIHFWNYIRSLNVIDEEDD
jgi:CDP-diacylglycerol--serine O-phosphatidyltransferase